MLIGTHTIRAPGPSGGLLGCLREFRGDPLGLLMRAAGQYGDVVRLRIGPVVAHLVNHPDLVEHVLQRHHGRYDKRTRSVSKIRATCGDSLLTTDGEFWRRHRRLIQPAFQPAALDRIAPLIVETTAALLPRWREAAAAGRPVDIVSEMLHLTLTVAARLLFGADVHGDADLIERHLKTVLADTWRRIESWFDPAAISPRFHARRFRRAVAEIDQVVYRIIYSRRAEGTGDDLLAILLRARDEQGGGGLTDQEVRDAVVTLLLAGHETTAHALAWAFYLLAEHPDVRERLHRELDEVLADRLPTLHDLPRLEYLECVVSETLRLYPSIWIMERRVTAEDELSGFRIPGGSTVLISPYVLHRRPDCWSDPEAFDPDRFLPARFEGVPRHAYIPFGAGPHHCIGRHMALLVMRLVLAVVLRSFWMEVVSGQRPALDPGITLRHAGDLWMRLHQTSDRTTT